MMDKLIGNITQTLENKPYIGMTSSITGGIIGKASMIHSETYITALSYITDFSVIIGFAIGILTLFLQAKKVYNAYFKNEIEK